MKWRIVTRGESAFTSIELIIVIAIIAIMAASSVPLGAAFLGRNTLRNKSNELLSSLRTARINSISGKNGSAWGVNTTSSEIILFSGASYATRDTGFDQVFTLPSAVAITQTEVVFARVTGEPATPVNINIGNDNGSRSIQINEVGAVDIN